MRKCEFCGAALVDGASFCGNCGHITTANHEESKQIGTLVTTRNQDFNKVIINSSPISESTLNENAPTESASPVLEKHVSTAISSLERGSNPGNNDLTVITSPTPFTPPNDLVNALTSPLPGVEQRFLQGNPAVETLASSETDEEEKRRRAALLGFGLPLAGALANSPSPGQAPFVQGTPQMAHMPNIAGTPPQGDVLSSGASGPSLHSAPGSHQLGTYNPPSHSPGHPGGSPNPSGPSGGTPGCLAWAAIVIATILLIVASLAGLFLTVWAPNLSLSGAANVTPGANIVLHGSHFLPNSSVTLTLDNGLPLYAALRATPIRLVRGSNPRAASIAPGEQIFLSPAATNVIATRGDGTFSVIFVVQTSWSKGKHTIHATEAPSRRSATLTFTIDQPGPNVTATIPPVPSPTASPVLSPTATTTTPSLSCVTPNTLTLGPVREHSTQTATGTITLCASGSGTLNWSASWDQNQAPWLQLDKNSGSLQAPAQDQVVVTASAQNLATGSYTTTITFTDLVNNTTQAVNVTLNVQGDCLNTKTQTLHFTGVQDTSDPANSQNITFMNCGQNNDWSAKVANNSSWLFLAPTSGTLAGGATTHITVTASNLKVRLRAGTYQDTVVIALGTQSISIQVVLTVLAPPTLSINPTTSDANSSSNCHYDTANNSICVITLTNQSTATSLTWSATPSNSNISVQASSRTVAAGGSEQVTIIVPASDCNTSQTVTFSGPGNSVAFTWTCVPVIF